MTDPKRRRIVIYGKDARTDAIAGACAASPARPELFIYSQFRIPGLIAKATRFHQGLLDDVDAMVAFARNVGAELAIIGPEEPLADGLVDALVSELGIPCFGPTQELAQIESSKTWSRLLVDKYGIAGNPTYEVVRAVDALPAVFERLGEFVVKPDGLTGGKGVSVFPEHFTDAERPLDAALDYASSLIADSGQVLIEERLDGEEFSLQTITDGTSFVHFPLVQDHKRALEGDTGPNTGGMGSYSFPDFSLPFLTEDEIAQARSINEQVAAALEQETGQPYRGVLYGGFMATADGIRLIEYNSRFGDPEAMNVLALLDCDFAEMAWATATGRLADITPKFRAEATVCKYIVPLHYPSGKGAGDPVSVDPEVRAADDVGIFWAATNLDANGTDVTLTGSRALAVVGTGPTVEIAESRAEWAANHVRGPVRHRRDVGTQELINRRIEHMESLRCVTGRR